MYKQIRGGIKNMERKLKVGDSFEVVEVLCCLEYVIDLNIFKIGGQTLCIGNKVLTNGNSKLFKGKNDFLFLNKRRKKPIGKLTITKLK